MVKTLIATCVKDETDYLEDFLKYHLNIGIDEIYIFEDFGSASHKNITDKYSKVHLMSIFDIFPKEQHPEILQMVEDKIPRQTLYINQILKWLHNNGYSEYWCWLIDVDEYITATEPISDILGRFSDRDAVLVYWKNYGCSGRLYKPLYDKPIYEIFTEPCGYELYSDFKMYKITKFCVNLNKWSVDKKFWIHNAPLNWIKADGTYKRTEIVFEPLYLRHYITKSVEEYLHKIYCRGMFHEGHRCLKSLKEMQPDMYEVAKNDKKFLSYFEDKYKVNLPPFE